MTDELLVGLRPKIEQAVIETLKLTTSMDDIDIGDALEIYIRCLLSLALEVADGDHALAANWIDECLIPNIKHFRKHLAKGGHTPPSVIDGNRVN
jgi:hypothetical protein